MSRIVNALILMLPGCILFKHGQETACEPNATATTINVTTNIAGLNIVGLNIASINMTISSFVNSTGDCCFSAQCCFSGLCFSGCLLDCARFAGSVSLDYICLIHSWLIDILPGNCSICFLDLPVQDCCCTLPCSALPSHSEDALHWMKFTQIRCLERAMKNWTSNNSSGLKQNRKGNWFPIGLEFYILSLRCLDVSHKLVLLLKSQEGSLSLYRKIPPILRRVHYLQSSISHRTKLALCCKSKALFCYEVKEILWEY